ncbi:MAG: 30S ribosomal protein S7 [Candidatus Eisenbacteria bacterium]|nr:30S ribosomal protein S7 [Candidatus Latescibacterota bacterium]MBD3301592.1 30S ribosomal protein S7 [Candidatus Eisenbacteria bacterium]
MPRRARITKRELAPDPKFNNVLVTRFINSLMKDGKRSTAERCLYGALGIIEKKTGQDGLSVMKQAMNNAKPNLEVKSRRVGGATYQVPVEIKPERRTALAIRWLIHFSKARPDHSMRERLASEFMAAAKNEGGTIKRRDDTHRMADANKAFAHYRW